MLPSYFAVIGAIIVSIGGFRYLYDTLKGKVQPNRITWFLWTLFPAIIFAAQLQQGVTTGLWATFAAGFTPALIFLASFVNKKAYWKTEPVDYVCLGLGLVGIILWAVTSNPNIAIIFNIGADLAASVPTIIKSFKHPKSESWVAYAISSVGFLLSLLAIHHWNFEESTFVVYLFVNQSLLAYLSSRRHEVEPKTKRKK